MPSHESGHLATTKCMSNHEVYGVDGNSGAGVGRGADGDGQTVLILKRVDNFG